MRELQLIAIGVFAVALAGALLANWLGKRWGLWGTILLVAIGLVLAVVINRQVPTSQHDFGLLWVAVFVFAPALGGWVLGSLIGLLLRRRG